MHTSEVITNPKKVVKMQGTACCSTPAQIALFVRCNHTVSHCSSSGFCVQRALCALFVEPLMNMMLYHFRVCYVLLAHLLDQPYAGKQQAQLKYFSASSSPFGSAVNTNCYH
jgi:hypothetical protein